MTFILPNASFKKKKNGKQNPVFITVELFSLLFIQVLKKIIKRKKIPSSSLAVLKWEYSAQVIPSYKIGTIFKLPLTYSAMFLFSQVCNFVVTNVVMLKLYADTQVSSLESITTQQF